MVKVYIGLGTNLGDREENLAQARDLIAAIPDSRILGMSSIYQTEPWGKTDQPDFLNQVLVFETDLLPTDLLHALQDVEISMGRVRNEKWGPRIIDLDILLYGDQIINESYLTIPHPFLTERSFVIIPLLEIDPALKLPDGRLLQDVFDCFDKLARSGCVINSSMLK